MKDAVFVASSFLFVFFGAVIWRVPAIGRLDRAARLSIAFAAGMLIAGCVMYFEWLVGIRWTRAALVVPMLLFASAVPWRTRTGARLPGTAWAEWTPLSAVLLLFAYGVATARATCADLLFFWGPKAVYFFQVRGIDVDFLRFPPYILMHPDYPPLQPLVHVWSSVAAHRFSYWGAMFASALYIAACVLAFRGLATATLGSRKASAYATLLAAVLAFGVTASNAAGGGDAMLIMYEVIALSAITFGGGAGAITLAAIGLAGAAFTKVEGAVFALCLVVVWSAFRRNIRSALIAVAPAALLLGSWIAVAWHYGLLESYGRSAKKLYFDAFGAIAGATLHEIRYGAFYLPWLAALAPLAGARSLRRALPALVIGVAAIVWSLYFYLHDPDPVWWIRASAQRVFLTPLAAFVVASAAASE